MSDASGPSTTLGDDGYLTGYPLTEAGLFALARTWPAPEMQRPGCVWTHTLYVGVTDLAVIENLADLSAFFQRPGLALNPKSYSSSLLLGVPREERRTSWLESERYLLTQLIMALYTKPHEKIVVADDSPAINREEVILALWSQQWPRLRRNFRFCSHTYADRSTDSCIFDLQFLPPGERARSRFADALEIPSLAMTDEQVVADAVNDLEADGTGGLRRFLRAVAGDLPQGREAFIPLTRLRRTLNEAGSNPTAFDSAIGSLEATVPNSSGAAIRQLVGHATAVHADSLPLPILRRALLFSIESTPDLSPAWSRTVFQRLWNSDPKSFVMLSDEPRFLSSIAAVLDELSLSEVADGVSRAEGVSELALSARPEVATLPEFWKCAQYATLSPEGGWARDLYSIIPAMTAATRPGLAAWAERAFNGSDLRDVIQKVILDESSIGRDWVAILAKDRGRVASLLSEGAGHNAGVLADISRLTDPDFVPNEWGEDPWWIAIKGIDVSLPDRDSQYLAAYLLTRSLGNSSRSSGELMVAAFDEVYHRAANSRLSDEAWGFLSPRLPSSLWWPKWDRCIRLRAGVVDTFIERGLSPALFMKVTQDDEVFFDLVALAADKWKGRQFLNDVRKTLEDSRQGDMRRRAKAIRQLL